MSRLAVEPDMPIKRSSIADGPTGTTAGPARRASRFYDPHTLPRPSVQYGGAGRRMSQISRTSISGYSIGTKSIPVKLQNTYKLGPDTGEKFESAPVRKIIHGVLESYLDGEKYDPKLCSNLAQNLPDVIKRRVKELGYARYKLICNVTIGQNCAQGMQVVSRCLWNKDTDNFAEAHFTKGDLFAVATVYALYYE